MCVSMHVESVNVVAELIQQVFTALVRSPNHRLAGSCGVLMATALHFFTSKEQPVDSRFFYE